MPYTPRRVMRIAKQESGGLLVAATLFEVFPIYLKAVWRIATQSQYTLGDLAAVVLDGGKEAVLVWRQDEYFFAR